MVLESRRLRGTGVSPGVAIGRVRLYRSPDPKPVRRRIKDTECAAEQKRLNSALEACRHQIDRLIRRNSETNTAAADILKTHLLLLDDPTLFGQARQRIADEFISAEQSVTISLSKAREQFAKIHDATFRERGKDVEDVCRRVIGNLMGVLGERLEELDEPVILIAHDLSPSDTASLPRDLILGFATEVGGPTSHTAILARSLQIPAVVGVSGLTVQVHDGDSIILDGQRGTVIVNPDAETIHRYQEIIERIKTQSLHFAALTSLPAVTIDGHPVTLLANIEFPEEVESVRTSGGTGIGLYRTEYLFMGRLTLPSEEEQYEAYRLAVESLDGKPVVIRTLDIGGDKFAHSLSIPEELNPFLGWRAVRFCIQNVDIFKTQLRAILRAAVHGPILLLYPLLSGVGELRQVNRILAQVKEELFIEGIPFNADIRAGGMIEVPSAVMMVDRLAEELSFLSIGTNDLIQYTLAVDRGNAKISHLYQPLHPAVLKMVANVVQAGHEHNIPVEVCGEMASDPLCALVLMALGVERLSMSPMAIPNIKSLIRSLRMDRVRALGERVVTIPTAEQVEDYARRVAQRLVPNYPWNKSNALS